MKDVEIFGIIVRTAGLIVALIALGYLLPAILSLIFGGPRAFLLFYGIPGLIVGLWLLRGAETIVSFAFPKSR